jgi:hypothetical protein
MIECDVHGLQPATRCCSHVAESLEVGRECFVDYVFDDYCNGYLFCVDCLEGARRFARTMQLERIEEYPMERRVRCWVHLQEWSESVNHVNLEVLFERAAERTGESPER